MLLQAWLPCTVSTVLLSRSLIVGRGRSSMTLAIRTSSRRRSGGGGCGGQRLLPEPPARRPIRLCRSIAYDSGRRPQAGSFCSTSNLRLRVEIPSEPHPVGVAVAVGADVGVAGGARRAGLAEDDHAGRAAVDTQGAT